jgi:ribose transport system substrate-binding protein
MKLAIFTKNYSNPAYAAARLGAERAAAVWGAQVMHYVPQTPDDPEQQSSLIDQALADRPDAFVFTPVHPSRVTAAVARIHAAGIPITGFVNRLPLGPTVAYVGSSDADLAADIAQYLFAHLKGQARVAVVEGPEDSPTSRERVEAFKAVASRHPGIELVAHVRGDYQREPARRAFAALLESHAALDGVLCANDIMAIGVLDALQAAGRQSAVVGVNAIPQAIDAIGRGDMLATADFNAMLMCHLATECAIRHLHGEAVPTEIALPVAIVDRHNWQDWNLPYEQRHLPSLKDVASCSVAH